MLLGIIHNGNKTVTPTVNSFSTQSSTVSSSIVLHYNDRNNKKKKWRKQEVLYVQRSKIDSSSEKAVRDGDSRLFLGTSSSDTTAAAPPVTATTNPNKNNDNNGNNFISGLLVLMTVPFAWGTYEVAIRYVYAANGDSMLPIPTFIFSLSYYMVATIALIMALIIAENVVNMNTTKIQHDDNCEIMETMAKPMAPEDGIVLSSSSFSNASTSGVIVVENDKEEESLLFSSSSSMSKSNPPLSYPESSSSVLSSLQSVPRVVTGGFELGFYLYLGNLCQMIGLQTIESDRAAFLLQLTTIFVPILQAIIIVIMYTTSTSSNSENDSINSTALDTISNTTATTTIPTADLKTKISTLIPPNVWLACIVAFIGVSVMSLDNPERAIATTETILTTLPSATNWINILLDWWQQQQGVPNNSIFGAFNILQLSPGDQFVITAAITYTFHCVRLEPITKQLLVLSKSSSNTLLSSSNASSSSLVCFLRLAICKSITETLLSLLSIVAVVWIAATAIPASSYADSSTILNFFIESGQESITYLQTMQRNYYTYYHDAAEAVAATTASSEMNQLSLIVSTISHYISLINIAINAFVGAIGVPTIISIVWIGLIPIAYTIFACSYGQSIIPASIANIIYTMQPICTSLLAYMVLQETLGTPGYIGGAFIGLAVLLVVLGSNDSSSNANNTIEKK